MPGQPANRILRIGLTGGIASGKSTVSALFGALGVPIIDTDELAREVVRPGSAGLAQIVAAFGPEVLDAAGGLDRRQLRARVFADAQARRQLEAGIGGLLQRFPHLRLDPQNPPQPRRDNFVFGGWTSLHLLLTEP